MLLNSFRFAEGFIDTNIYDPDALFLFSRSSRRVPYSQKQRINTLITVLRSANIWSKLRSFVLTPKWHNAFDCMLDWIPTAPLSQNIRGYDFNPDIGLIYPTADIDGLPSLVSSNFSPGIEYENIEPGGLKFNSTSVMIKLTGSSIDDIFITHAAIADSNVAALRFVGGQIYSISLGGMGFNNGEETIYSPNAEGFWRMQVEPYLIDGRTLKLYKNGNIIHSETDEFNDSWYGPPYGDHTPFYTYVPNRYTNDLNIELIAVSIPLTEAEDLILRNALNVYLNS